MPLSTAKAAPGGGTILLLAAVAALGSLATQLLVPALPQVARDLHAGVPDAQLVIGVFLIGLGAGQLLMGPLTDRIGRRPVLLAGLALYCLGSLAAAIAPVLSLLLLARAAQALGASAGVVTARVLVSDLYPPEQAAAKQATLMGVVLVSPALAPVIGGALTEWLGWRAVFGLLALAGAAGALLAATRLPVGPSRPIVQDRKGKSLPRAYRLLCANRQFCAGTLAIAGNSAALYMFLGTAPFLLEHGHGLSPRETGLCMLLIAGASIGGTFMVGRIERSGNALLTGTATSMAGSLVLLALAALHFGGLAAFIGPMMLLGLGAGMTGPSGITRVIRSQPGMEGTAASLAGATQMLASALCAWLLGHFAPVDALKLALGIVPAAGLAVLAATLSRKPPARTMQGLARAESRGK
ncbi:MAG: Bcr/CflA family efflux MFS transporter [Sphingomonadales bacterium]|nr:Bcr/CflA family efflux MFS transporter [Sphingomonadales bacterium]